jgi:hypothetical protein
MDTLYPKMGSQIILFTCFTISNGWLSWWTIFRLRFSHDSNMEHRAAGWVTNRRGTASLSSDCFSFLAYLFLSVRHNSLLDDHGDGSQSRVVAGQSSAPRGYAVGRVLSPLSPADSWPPWAEGAQAHGGHVEQFRCVKEVCVAAPRGGDTGVTPVDTRDQHGGPGAPALRLIWISTLASMVVQDLTGEDVWPRWWCNYGTPLKILFLDLLYSTLGHPFSLCGIQFGSSPLEIS